VRSRLYRFFGEALTFDGKVYAPFKPNETKVNSTVALKAGVLQVREKQTPFWVVPFEEKSAEGLISCRNGLLDLGARGDYLGRPPRSEDQCPYRRRAAAVHRIHCTVHWAPIGSPMPLRIFSMAETLATILCIL
jgi:hypothetical protein